MREPDGCPICGADLQQPARGRRRRYCSVPCRKASELEIRRANRRLEALEEGASKARMWGGEYAAEQLPRYEDEIRRVSSRLLTLLGRPS